MAVTELPEEAVRWAKTSLCYLDSTAEALDQALQKCKWQRQAPEFREATRLLRAARKLIEERV